MWAPLYVPLEETAWHQSRKRKAGLTLCRYRPVAQEADVHTCPRYGGGRPAGLSSLSLRPPHLGASPLLLHLENFSSPFNTQPTSPPHQPPGETVPAPSGAESLAFLLRPGLFSMQDAWRISRKGVRGFPSSANTQLAAAMAPPSSTRASGWRTVGTQQVQAEGPCVGWVGSGLHVPR